MAVITTQIQGAVGQIKVNGRFTFEDHGAFKTAVKNILEGHWITEIDLVLSDATYLDSNALSMIIGLRERANSKSITLKLVKPSSSVRTILEMVQFDTIFPIID